MLEIEAIHDCELGMVSNCVGDTELSPDTDGRDQNEVHHDEAEGDDDVMVPWMNERLDAAL